MAVKVSLVLVSDGGEIFPDLEREVQNLEARINANNLTGEEDFELFNRELTGFNNAIKCFNLRVDSKSTAFF